MIKAKIILKAAIAVLIVICSSIFSNVGSGGAKAFAATRRVAEAYEAQNVWEDLRGMTADGESLDLTVYDFNARKNVQIISFVEFCYSPFSGKQDDFGLYVYIYNPRGADWTQNTQLNKIQLRIGGQSTATFVKYPLEYLNRSTEAGSEGLFYKFKIVMTDRQRTSALDSLNSAGRLYEVSGVELYSEGASATEYKIANKYTYTGLAEGYGVEWAGGDTLTCECAGMDVTLTLDVHSTFYRPEGTNGKDAYTQDSLHSVYFAIPNEILSKYGGLTAVHATWLNAVTAPYLVMGNKGVYDTLKKYVGVDIGYRDMEVGYELLGAEGTDSIGQRNAEIAYNAFSRDIYHEQADGSFVGWKRELSKITGIFRASGDIEGYTVSGDRLLEYMHDYTKSHDASELVLGKFNRELFDSVDAKFTDINVKATDGYTLTSEKLDKTWWQKLFGGSYVESSNSFDVLEAIHPLTDDDFKGTPEEVCDRLYVDKYDYDDLKAYYNLRGDNTVFLLRYQKSDYKGWTVRTYQYRNTGLGVGEFYIDDNAYFFQETVNLDFDIIDVTCRKGNVETVIACIMSPKDIVHDATPPIGFEVTSDFWIYGLIIIVAAMALFVLCVPLSRKIGERAMALIGSFLITLITAVLRVLAGLYTYKYAWLSKAVLPLNIICGVLAGIFVVFVVIEIVQAIRTRRDRNNRM